MIGERELSTPQGQQHAAEPEQFCLEALQQQRGQACSGPCRRALRFCREKLLGKNQGRVGTVWSQGTSSTCSVHCTQIPPSTLLPHRCALESSGRLPDILQPPALDLCPP